MVVVWEGRRCTGWFWLVFDRSQKGSGLGLNFGLGWAFGLVDWTLEFKWFSFGFGLVLIRSG